MSRSSPSLLKGIILITVLDMVISCSVQFSVSNLPKMAPQEVPSPDSTKTLDFANEFKQLVHLGLLENVTDFSGIPLTYIVVDTSNNPVPNAKFIVELDGARIVYYTNEYGEATVAFDSVAIVKQPIIYGVKNKTRYNVSFNFQYSGSTSDTTFAVAEFSTLTPYVINNDIIVLSKKIPIDTLQVVKEMLIDEYGYITQALGVPPVKWGTAFLDIGDSFTVPQSRYNFQGDSYKIFTYQTQDIYRAMITTNVHEWVEQTLLEHIPFEGAAYRWVTDGIAEWTKWAYYARLSDTTRQEFGMPSARVIAALKNLIHYLKQEGQQTYTLTDWKALKTTAKEKMIPTFQPSNEAIRYQVAASFWMEVAQNDSSIIPTYLSELTAMNTVSGEKAQSKLETLLPTDLRSALQAYPVSRAVRVYQNYLSKLEH